MTGQRRSGSSMSDRQIAYAAVAGRKVAFTPLTGDSVEGYVCGADDYHWLVVTVKRYEDLPEGEFSITNTLVHKSAPTVSISPVSTLADEPPVIRAAVEGVGRGFWLFCNKTYFGKDEPTAQTSQVRELVGSVSAFVQTARPHHSPRQEKTA